MRLKNLIYGSELPLQQDKANFFLEISTAVFVFLFSITLAAYFMISVMIASWNKSIIDGLTVQIMPPAEAMTQEDVQLRINKVIFFMQGLDGVETVKQVSDKKIKKIMSPWLGTNANIDDLPMPRLLNVHLKNGQNFDYRKASDSLKEIAPYASIDNHGIWLQKLVKSASSLKALSVFILLLVLASAVFSLFYAVETSLKVHQNIIEILHIMGATDNYVANQYAIRGLKVGFIASFIGMILSILALWAISHLSSGLETGLIGSAKLTGVHWGFLISLPIWTALLSMVLSFFCVKKTLGKIM